MAAGDIAVSTKYVHGQWNVICDRCGRKFKSGQLRKEWTGLRVCTGPGTSDCWEPKHPQLSIRSIPDNPSVPWARPEAVDVEYASCTATGRLGIAGYAVADCTIVEFTEASAYDADTIPESTFNLNTL